MEQSCDQLIGPALPRRGRYSLTTDGDERISLCSYPKEQDVHLWCIGTWGSGTLHEPGEKTQVRRIAAVIVHYGDQQRTIRAVLNHWKLSTFSDIVVVANDLSQKPQALHDIPCTWVLPTRNLGFGGACQLGATVCSADVYAFFNPHVRIDKEDLERCVSAFNVREVGIAGPYVHHRGVKGPIADSRNVRCTRTYSKVLRMPIQIPISSTGPVDAGSDPAELLDNEWATGGAIFCRNEVIRNIKWDGSYFLSFEDVDLSMRSKKAGWRVVVAPSAMAFHTGESTRTPTSSAYYGMRNPLWFARKYHNRRVRILLTLYLLLLVGRLATGDLLKWRRPFRSRPAMRGMVDGWMLCPRGIEALPDEPLWSSDF